MVRRYKMTEIIKHTSLADFLLDENGQLICSLNINFTEFDVDVQQYLKGDDEITEQEYELIYAEVDKKCNDSGEYIIDCFKDRYTVRKTADIESLHYETLTAEEKLEYDIRKEEELKQSRIVELESYLASTDWYAIRESETGIDMPADIKQARADARTEISTLRGDI